MQSKIEWCDRSDWNPIRGCTRVSPGCGGPGKHGGCYAEKIAARFSGPGQPFEGYAEMRGGEARWTGKVGLIEEHLTAPLRWRKPQRIFVNSMSDLFHESVKDEWIDKIFAMMALCPQHRFMVLTKRSARMREYLSAYRLDAVAEAANRAIPASEWPLKNCWLGVSAEDQANADARIPDLLATPAAVRYVSYEPALGPIDFLHVGGDDYLNALSSSTGPNLDLIIYGGESGRNARSAIIGWARDTLKQCEGTLTKFFMKQMGSKPTNREGQPHHIKHPKGGDISEFPVDLRVREMPR